MEKSDSYIVEDRIVDRFDISLNRKPLALFLGAGVNHGVTKCPSWGELLKEVIRFSLNNYEILNSIDKNERKKIEQHLLNDCKEFNVYHQASVIKQWLGGQYITVLQNALYAKYLDMKCNVQWNKNNLLNDAPFLSNIAKLCLKANCISNNCKFVSSIVTYNYDDFLRLAIEQFKPAKEESEPSRKVFNVVAASHYDKSSKTSLPIYHVHGFIPSPDDYKNIGAKPSVVLSYDEYFQNMLDPYSWQTSTQLHFLRNYTCLFLGTSLTDWNMLRLISTAFTNNNNLDIYAMFS